MALSNRERVGRVLEQLTAGLGPVVIRGDRLGFKGGGGGAVEAGVAA